MLEDLYTCIARSSDDMRLEADICLNADHSVYAGHFPERPVVPGVCQLHIINELVAQHLGRPVRCVTIRELKFLSPITPQEDARLGIILSFTSMPKDQFGVQGTITRDEVVKTKIKAIFA